MTLINWLWYLIPRWLLRCISARFPEQLLKCVVSWRSSSEYSMIRCFLGDAFGGFEVLFCSVGFGCRWYTPLTTGTMQKVMPIFLLGCVRVWRCSSYVDMWQYNVYWIRSCVTLCTLFGVLYLYRMCYSAGYTQCFSRAKLSRTAGLATSGLSTSFKVPSQCLCGTILPTQYSMVWDRLVYRAGPMRFYWPVLHALFLTSTVFHFPYFFLYVGIVVLIEMASNEFKLGNVFWITIR